ncbi:hypothetical protein PVK06_025617 [Gossypium arboreum]|uniref:Uncharacterized protein n=1 Tax=Gossypium arboreum TaxID=29729 RepID=A0ABR0PHB6_GOSAR|nr:hypothetical protein PVK06_025617 [Gossypium arboreum]
MTATSSGWKPTSDSERFYNYTRRYDVFPMTSTGEGTSNTIDVSGFKNEDDNESDMDLVWEPGADSSEITLFSKLEPVPTELEDSEGGEYEEEEDPRFMNLCHIGAVDSYTLDSFLVQPSGGVLVIEVMVSVDYLIRLHLITIITLSVAIVHSSILE